MAALMSSVLDLPEKVAYYTSECKAMGIQLLPPDVNESNDGFTVSGNNIRYGLVAVKNIGRGFIQAVMAERERGGKFTGFDEFCERMYGTELNKRAVESLIKCGGFDSMGYKRSQLLRVCGSVVDNIAETRRKNLEGQLDLFGGFAEEEEEAPKSTLELPDIPEFSPKELMAMEREVTGLFLSGHPMDEYRVLAAQYGAVPIARILASTAEEEGSGEFKDNQTITVSGVVSAMKTKTTRNNTLMSYITLEDGGGSIELLAFQRALDTGGMYLRENAVVMITGRLSIRDEKEPQIVAEAIRPITDLHSAHMDKVPESRRESQESIKGRKLYVRLPGESDPSFERIKLILVMFPGDDPMILYFNDTGKKRGTHCLIHNSLIRELREMLGDENVVVK